MQKRESCPIIVVIGPSGVGKSTAVRILVEEGVVRVTPSWTTRPPRPNELVEGVEHKFVSGSTFKRKLASGFFLEYVKPFGLENYYGLPKIDYPPLPALPLIMLRANLIPLLKKHYKNFVIYQIEDDYKNVKQRLKDRQNKGEDIGTRLDDYNKELSNGRELANRIFKNKSPEQLSIQLQNAIKKDFAEWI